MREYDLDDIVLVYWTWFQSAKEVENRDLALSGMGQVFQFGS
ncbi:MAG TPA: hypothetical protein VJ935_00915 [Acidimicrobiia bacterium]|nr:hypothetical protein [Acidimicrobiia bacterium]